MHVTEADDLDRPADSDIDVIEVDFVATDESLAGWIRLDARRALGATRFLVALLVAREDPVVLIDYDLPLARTAYEFRSSGVWTEFVCETPLDHWTIGLEAFALRIDPSGTVTPDTFGDRVPIGLDLDLDTVGAPEGDASSFSIELDVHGEVLIADRAWDLTARGTRTRASTGVRHPLHLVAPAAPTIAGDFSIGWPDELGQMVLERRGWVGGNRPGWVTLPVQSVE
ncbi:MAG: hypothetical protein P8J50_15495 [Acidimicrobiales bacterium]|jgi:hypothetical protein|nr:hypothetical protein [Acidimicrobiales bacterium]